MPALILDFDGVIVDSELYWPAAEMRAFSRILPDWTEEDVAKTMGMNVDDIRLLVQERGKEFTQQEFREYFGDIAHEVYASCQLIEGIEDLITQARNLDWSVAIASSSRRPWIETALERFGLQDHFDVIASVEDIDGPGKPAPDIYLHAAHLLKKKPEECLEECLVVEDSKNGVLSAKAANMTCIALRTQSNQQQDLSAADREITAHSELDLSKVF